VCISSGLSAPTRVKPVEQIQAAPTQINVVLNWTEELKRL